MKKVILLGVVAAGFAMTSCKKNYSCNCTTNVTTSISGEGTTYSQTSSSTTITDTEKNAQLSCDAMDGSTYQTIEDGYISSSTGCNLSSN